MKEEIIGKDAIYTGPFWAGKKCRIINCKGVGNYSKSVIYEVEFYDKDVEANFIEERFLQVIK